MPLTIFAKKAPSQMFDWVLNTPPNLFCRFPDMRYGVTARTSQKILNFFQQFSSPITPFLHFFAFSYSLQYFKPFPNFFQHILLQVHVSFHKCLAKDHPILCVHSILFLLYYFCLFSLFPKSLWPTLNQNVGTELRNCYPVKISGSRSIYHRIS